MSQENPDSTLTATVVFFKKKEQKKELDPTLAAHAGSGTSCAAHMKHIYYVGGLKICNSCLFLLKCEYTVWLCTFNKGIHPIEMSGALHLIKVVQHPFAIVQDFNIL